MNSLQIHFVFIHKTFIILAIYTRTLFCFRLDLKKDERRAFERAKDKNHSCQFGSIQGAIGKIRIKMTKTKCD